MDKSHSDVSSSLMDDDHHHQGGVGSARRSSRISFVQRGRRYSTASIMTYSSTSCVYNNDVHVLTGVIKSILRDGIGASKEPVCTFGAYSAFLSASRKIVV